MNRLERHNEVAKEFHFWWSCFWKISSLPRIYLKLRFLDYWEYALLPKHFWRWQSSNLACLFSNDMLLLDHFGQKLKLCHFHHLGRIIWNWLRFHSHLWNRKFLKHDLLMLRILRSLGFFLCPLKIQSSCVVKILVYWNCKLNK